MNSTLGFCVAIMSQVVNFLKAEPFCYFVGLMLMAGVVWLFRKIISV